MKNYWLDRKKEKKEKQRKLLDDAMIVYKLKRINTLRKAFKK